VKTARNNSENLTNLLLDGLHINLHSSKVIEKGFYMFLKYNHCETGVQSPVWTKSLTPGLALINHIWKMIISVRIDCSGETWLELSLTHSFIFIKWWHSIQPKWTVVSYHYPHLFNGYTNKEHQQTKPSWMTLAINFFYINYNPFWECWMNYKLQFIKNIFPFCGFCLSDVVESCFHFFARLRVRTQVAEVKIQQGSHWAIIP